MSDAMKSLLAMIEAGDRIGVKAFLREMASASRDKGELFMSYDMEKAFDGDLNAAKVLHEELLPTRSCGITFGGEYGATVTFPPTWDDLSLSQSHAIPARAWLIAILRAKIKEGDA